MEKHIINLPDIERSKDNPADFKVLGTYHTAETALPKVLVDTVQTALGTLPQELITSPLMYDPNNMNIIFGILERNDDHTLTARYRVTLSVNMNDAEKDDYVKKF